MPTAATTTATNAPLLQSVRHIREQLAHLRMLGPIPVIVVESPAGSKVDQDSLDVARQSLACGVTVPDHQPCVFGSVDRARGGTVSVHLARELDAAWTRFHRVAGDAHRIASTQFVELGILHAPDVEPGSWIVDVARTLERLEPPDACAVRLRGGAAKRWTPTGRFLIDERSILNPMPQFAKLLDGATAHRYLLLEDAVEASIAVLDLLVGRLEVVRARDEQSPPAPEVDPGRLSRGKSPTGGTKPTKKRGRNPNREGDRKEDRAAFWMFKAVDLVASHDELRRALDHLGPEPKPRHVYEALRLHGLEISRDAVRNNPPLCWPCRQDGTPEPSWSFANYAVDVNVEAFERYLRTYRRTVGGEAVAKPRAASPADVTRETMPASPATGPSRSEIRTRTIVGGAEKIEEALGRVNSAMQSGVDAEIAWKDLRRLLVERLRMRPADADTLIGGKDRDAIDRISRVVVQARKTAGDTGDRGKRKRPS